MSSNLTYVNFYDTAASTPEFNSVPTVFTSYNEAKEWAFWYMNVANSWVGLTDFFIMIWNAGDEQNGFVRLVGGVPVFTPY